MNPLLFVLDAFEGPTAGTEAQCWLLIQELIARGHCVRIATLRPSRYLQSAAAPGSYECPQIYSLRSPRAWVNALCFAWRARRAGVRVAHLVLNDVSILLPVFLWALRIKVIISRRDLGFWISRPVRWVLRCNRTFVARVITNCPAVRDVTLREEGYSPQKVLVVPNGCQGPPLAPPSLALRVQYNVPPRAVLMGVVANLRPLKRLEDAIRAVRLAQEAGQCVQLMIAGADLSHEGRPYRERLLDYAEQQGVAGAVHFVGLLSREHVWAFLQSVDLVLSCSETEGLSNSLIEAMSCGTAVIASAVGGSPGLIQPEVTGCLYPARNVEALAQAVVRLSRDPCYRAALGLAAQAWVRAHFSVDALVNAHIDLYRQVVSAPRPVYPGSAIDTTRGSAP